ncbi:hypothetical protein [Citrobacter sp. ESBL3]|uniref:hypothetical protein n=1 Tax=Citrobacter sp. ESBL3 TaxID=3077326 RepID=UPI002FCA15CA
MRKWLSILLLLLNPFALSACLADGIKVSTLHKGDAEYQDVSDEFKREGVVTKIISVDTPGGQYYFVFLEQRLKKTVHTGDETTLYGLKRNGEWGEIRKTKDDDNTDVVKTSGPMFCWLTMAAMFKNKNFRISGMKFTGRVLFTRTVLSWMLMAMANLNFI